MKMKDSKTSIANLNPVFTDSLQKFDLLHIQLIGTQAVVTSTNHGKHWGKLKKHQRPVGWENMTEKQVRSYSNSKHYTNEALDFRRRNPDPDSDLNYYDDLTESEQRYFMVEIYKCFPDELFDIVFSRLCIHVEWDPKLKSRLEIERGDDKIKLDGETKNRIDELSQDEPEKPTELPKLPIWRKSGFKRVGSFVIGGIGLILELIPEYSGIGRVVMYFAGGLGILGTADGIRKNKKADDKTQLILSILKWIWGQITKLITSKKEN